MVSASALNLIEFPEKKKFLKAVKYLNNMQRFDGGWGEDGNLIIGFENHSKKSTPSQSAWAIMGLIAAGKINSIEVKNGIKYLLKNNLNGKRIITLQLDFLKYFI